MSSIPKPVNQLLPRNAIRRKATGYRVTPEIYHCRSIDLACNEFFRGRGIPCFGKFGSQAPR